MCKTWCKPTILEVIIWKNHVSICGYNLHPPFSIVLTLESYNFLKTLYLLNSCPRWVIIQAYDNHLDGNMLRCNSFSLGGRGLGPKLLWNQKRSWCGNRLLQEKNKFPLNISFSLVTITIYLGSSYSLSNLTKPIHTYIIIAHFINITFLLLLKLMHNPMLYLNYKIDITFL